MRMVAYRRVGWKIKAHGESLIGIAAEEKLSLKRHKITMCMREYLMNLGCITLMAFKGHIMNFKPDSEINPKKAVKYNRSYLDRAWEGIYVPWSKQAEKKMEHTLPPPVSDWLSSDETDDDDDYDDTDNDNAYE